MEFVAFDFKPFDEDVMSIAALTDSQVRGTIYITPTGAQDWVVLVRILAPMVAIDNECIARERVGL